MRSTRLCCAAILLSDIAFGCGSGSTARPTDGGGDGTTSAIDGGEGDGTTSALDSATPGDGPDTVSNDASPGDAGGPSDASIAAAPALVQHVSGSSTRNNNFANPYCYYFQLPGGATAGNSVVVGFTFNGNPTPTVTDDKDDRYAIEENTDDTADTQSVGIAAAFDVAAGLGSSLCASAPTPAATCNRWRPSSRASRRSMARELAATAPAPRPRREA